MLFSCPAAPWQAPQSEHRKEKGEDRGHLQRDERPDPEMDSAGVGDPTAHKSHTPHVGHRDDRSQDRPEKDDD